MWLSTLPVLGCLFFENKEIELPVCSVWCTSKPQICRKIGWEEAWKYFIHGCIDLCNFCKRDSKLRVTALASHRSEATKYFWPSHLKNIIGKRERPLTLPLRTFTNKSNCSSNKYSWSFSGFILHWSFTYFSLFLEGFPASNTSKSSLVLRLGPI